MTEADRPEPAEGTAPDEAVRLERSQSTSPYATGGGGVTFERKVATSYLARLLVGDGAVELGDTRRVVSVAFQQGPQQPVDDLVVTAARADETDPSLVLSIAVRRAPNIVASDAHMPKLIRDFVQAVGAPPPGEVEYRFALVVAGPQDHARQLASLARLAADQVGPDAYTSLVRTPGKFPADLVRRQDHVERLVHRALVDLGTPDPSTVQARRRTWELLSKLEVLMPRLESPDETDWATVLNSLRPVARGGDLAGAARLRDRLVALVADYPATAATVDVTALRRSAHTELDSSVRRHRQGWQVLSRLNQQALTSVDAHIRSADGSRHLSLERGSVAVPLPPDPETAVVVHGDSGVGKSALVLRAVSSALHEPTDTQAVVVDLRHLPRLVLDLEHMLGAPLGDLLSELSAPQRLLVVDAADGVAEGRLDQFRHLVAAAHDAQVGVVAITTEDNRGVVADTLARRFGDRVLDRAVPALTDEEIDEVLQTFDELTDLAEHSGSRALLRRPVVVDLLVRSGVRGTPVSDADAMMHVWRDLVRRREQADRGNPLTRELAMLRLAEIELSGGDPLGAEAIDPTALDGLRRDGLVRMSTEDPFRVGPEFAHDEVRRYAVARLLLSMADLTTRLLDAGVPRWALGAARLACQAHLGAADGPGNRVRGRVSRLQSRFDALVDAGHGERWGDLPGEAMLALGDPRAVLRDAWAELCAGDANGLRRLCRLIDQRFRDADGLVRLDAVEPVVELLLDIDAPWSSGHPVRQVLRSWLRARVVANTPPGHPTRLRLRERLVAMCADAETRLAEERSSSAAASVFRSPRAVWEEHLFRERYRGMFDEIGFPRSRPRRRRREVPSEVTEEIVLELLALLGPDLGDDGEAILRRVAGNEPSRLAPAVEEPFTGRALATYGRGLLAHLTEAYYVDDDDDMSGLHDEGIRDHHARAGPVWPLAAWYRGPFAALVGLDFRNGVAVLNRMLNHAVRARVRSLADLPPIAGEENSGAEVPDEYRTDLAITGVRRWYVGDPHAWFWYRGAGVGPYPCMSALQALERTCDELIECEIPLARIMEVLLDGCENLAMVGLVVGLLVRHLERADHLVDPYLVEPEIWSLEFARPIHEASVVASDPAEIVHPERRGWSFREVVMTLVVAADETRSAELLALGDQLVANAGHQAGAVTEYPHDTVAEAEMAPVRAWASGFDRSTYSTRQVDGGLYIQSEPSAEIVQALQATNDQLGRAQHETRLLLRYHIRPRRQTGDADVSSDELAADLAVARDLLDEPPEWGIGERWEAPTAVAAAALRAHLLRDRPVPVGLMAFAVETVLQVGAGAGAPRQFEYEGTYFEQGADRSAAGVIPLLLLPSAAVPIASVDAADGAPVEQVMGAAMSLAGAVASEVRLHLARGLDEVWRHPCISDGRCHHDAALQLALETLRDSGFGEWDPDFGRRRILRLADPIITSLAGVPDDSIRIGRLDAALRALAPAAAARCCVSRRAREAFDVVQDAHRRSLLTHERNVDHRATHALVVARALLTLIADGEADPVLEHVRALGDSPDQLGGFLRALSAAAEEAPERAHAARRCWPAIVSGVLDLAETGHRPFDDRHLGSLTLAALIPNPAGDTTFLYSEVLTEPITWWDLTEWTTVVERWLPFAVGDPSCADHIVAAVSGLPVEEQVRIALPWVAALVLPAPDRIAHQSFMLAQWLIDTRSAASDGSLIDEWQLVVDALVVAGEHSLAAYSD